MNNGVTIWACRECGQSCDGRTRHDYIDCVIHRWEAAEYELGRIPGHKLKADMRAVTAVLRELRDRP